jgi:pimeloyl-ACP methyl ester carboxylesterase
VSYAAINGLQLYYEIHGTEGGTPLVALHGGGSSIDTTFGAYLPQLSKGRRVIAFDQQGHGRTADADRPFDFEQSADDAAALLHHLEIGRADFFGYSNGGTIALQIAIRHPGIVRRLVLMSCNYNRGGMGPEFWAGFEHAELSQMPAELREAYLAAAPHPEHLQSFFDKSVQRMRTFRDIPAEALRAIDAPSLIIAGDNDVTRPEHAVEMFRTLPHAHLAILPATDHMAIVKNAEPAASMISAFLNAP